MSRVGEERTFGDFKERARDDSLTQYEKVGFPNCYREGKEELIFADIERKLPNLSKGSQLVLDIGPGCSGPALMMIDCCRRQGHQLILIDSQEMLNLLPKEPFVQEFAGRYPDQCRSVFDNYAGQVNVIVCYSVLHYIFAETNLFDFLDRSLTLLAPGGEMLIGDIPNVSKRRRFFSSPNGIRFHQSFTGTAEVPDVRFNQPEPGKIDDAVLLSLLLRARTAGYDAYILPQPETLPMANRREDMVILKP